ncbi:hypothetical protein [Streptomyces marincola]|uniref:hypothetical protein n=1 Tax=Streptomyces marincola TaxID=2878388 RepID=UPI001CF56142|nr:hypothetical protein [Streptomyces marincola]UCM89438.1 hypothetical protein LC193_16600 [Streptomyces marincola]
MADIEWAVQECRECGHPRADHDPLVRVEGRCRGTTAVPAGGRAPRPCACREFWPKPQDVGGPGTWPCASCGHRRHLPAACRARAVGGGDGLRNCRCGYEPPRPWLDPIG